MHYYKRNIGDYAKKAGRLSMLEDGAFTRLLDTCYDRERFPTEAEAIEWTWSRSQDEIDAVLFVLSRFFEKQEDGTYVQPRVRDELHAFKAGEIANRLAALAREARKKERDEYAEACDELKARIKRDPLAETPEAWALLLDETTRLHAPARACTNVQQPLTTNQEPLTKNQEPRTRNQEPDTAPAAPPARAQGAAPPGSAPPDKPPPKSRQPWHKRVAAPDGVSGEDWRDYCEARKAKGRPMAEGAIKRFVAAFEQTRAETGLDPGHLIGRAIEGGWQTIKPEYVTEQPRGPAGRGKPYEAMADTDRFRRLAEASERGDNPFEAPQRHDALEGELA